MQASSGPCPYHLIAVRRAAELRGFWRIFAGAVTNRTARLSAPRAVRLRTEAGNCLTIAVGQRDPAFAAELIDEAIRLMRRARELDDERAA